MAGGRPKKEIDFEQVDKLCALQCTGEEIASFLGVHYNTLDNKCKENFSMGFCEYFDTKKGVGRVSLRRRQWKAADDGNVTMLIWLGKQYLGQSDKNEMEHSGVIINIIDTVAAEDANN